MSSSSLSSLPWIVMIIQTVDVVISSLSSLSSLPWIVMIIQTVDVVIVIIVVTVVIAMNCDDNADSRHVELWCQERLLIQHVKYHLWFAGDSGLLQQDLAEYLLVSTNDMWQHSQVASVSFHDHVVIYLVDIAEYSTVRQIKSGQKGIGLIHGWRACQKFIHEQHVTKL